MILIFGGAYQGKLDYAMERFGFTDGNVYRCGDGSIDSPGGAKIVYGIDKWILALVNADANADNAVRQFIEDNRDSVVICSDISCGVVPADPVLRKWREAVGRALSALADASDEVHRLFCGIPTRIK